MAVSRVHIQFNVMVVRVWDRNCIDVPVMDITLHTLIVTAVASKVYSLPVPDPYYNNFVYPDEEFHAYDEDHIANRQADTENGSRSNVVEPPRRYGYRAFDLASEDTSHRRISVDNPTGSQARHDRGSVTHPSADSTKKYISIGTTFGGKVYQQHNPESREELLQSAQTRYYYYYPYFRVRRISRRRWSRPRHPLSNYEDSYDKFPTVA
ncbi:unnamed protein product [Acanthoscelides obtectus]|uniref:Uncharacterized protein n=1 Tax=Acanthoscelides obtectus TaxID=200917 RepID=A0A9P0LT83_ACAOB|nr:unnamed protein product [Acanthoscelides obtectus]CAK1652431.1 hypothetical protein AOBTE_LOCUS17838 [Acanthoscelides obtectus]